MFKRKTACVLLCLVLAFSVFTQDIVKAESEVRSAVCTIAAVAVGVILVASGVGAAVAAGSIMAPAWTTATVAVPIVGTLTAGSTAVLGGAFLVGAVSMNGESGGGGSGGAQDCRVELKTFDRNEGEPASILITLKDSVSGNGIVDLPAGTRLYVKHSNPNTLLVEGYEPPRTASISSSSSNFVDINNCPQVSVVGIPSEIKYSVQSQCQSVKMDIINSSGSVVYSLTESSPNPARPIPFVWKGMDRNGNGAPPGVYTVRMKAIKPDGTAEYSPIQIMNIGNTLNAGTEYEITSFSGGTATVRVWPPIDGSSTSDTVTVTLRQGDRVISSASEIVNFSGGAPTAPIVSQKTLDFLSVLSGRVEDIPVRIEIPGNNARTKILKVKVNEGAADWIIYEYNLNTYGVSMKGPFGTKNYTSSDGVNYYTVLNMMKIAGRKAFKEAGIEYNFAGKSLSVDSAKLVDKSGVGSGYSVSVNNSSNIISITISDGTNNLIASYDTNSNTVSLPPDYTFADSYDWDLTNNMMAAVWPTTSGPSASGIRATGAMDDFRNKAMKLLPFPCAVIIFESYVASEWISHKNPMDRPVDPDITDIVWVERRNRTVRIIGTAGNGIRPRIYVTSNDVTTDKGVAESLGTTWQKEIALGQGENKINAIVRTTDGREVESGDATVYAGTVGEPDFILVSPRDRQVFASKNINPLSRTRISLPVKGRISPLYGFKIIVNGAEKHIYIKADNSFEENKIVELFEGENTIACILSDAGNKTFNKTILGAYRFATSESTTATGYILRRGDFTFSNKTGSVFDVIPAEPDHAGIYIGNGYAIDALKNDGVRRTNLNNTDSIYNFYIREFNCATQVPKIINEAQRANVGAKAVAQEGKPYDRPFPTSWGNPLGHYDGPTNGFYCSEVSYWSWHEIVGDNFGVNITDIMFPFRGENNLHNAILPAFLCEKTMKVKELR